MSPSSAPRPDAPATPPHAAGLAAALAELLRAHDLAMRANQDVWQFAVEHAHLERLGVSPCDLRWLLCDGHLRHAVETTRPGAPARSFRPVAHPGFPERVCFVLTEPGVTAARRLRTAAQPAPILAIARGRRTPCWEGDSRKLRVDGAVVKRFSQPAPSQQRVLDAFAEEGWPDQIDDPLTGTDGVDARRRLHQTAANLNRGQRGPLVVRFHVGGAGQAIGWELAEQE